MLAGTLKSQNINICVTYLDVNAGLFHVFPKKTCCHHPEVSVKDSIVLAELNQNALSNSVKVLCLTKLSMSIS